MAPDDNAGPIGLGAGISDDPGQGAELGDLNPLNRKIIQTELFDPHTSDFLAATRRVASENYVSDSLAKRGSFKGIVLRVEPPGPSSQLTSYLDGQAAAVPSVAPSLVRIKARIPELHIALPIPAMGDVSNQQSGHIIDLYPTYVAINPGIQTPAPGDLVYLDYDDKQNWDGPQFLGSINQQSYGAGMFGISPYGMSAFAAANGCSPLAATGAPGTQIFPGGMPWSTVQAPSLPGGSAGVLGQNGALIDELIGVADAANNRNERIPEELALRIVREGHVGLLALFLGAANWGISWNREDPPDDPAGLNWAGPIIGKGKHIRDHDIGGVGIPHIDSSFLKRDLYDTFGFPPGPLSLQRQAWEDYLRNTNFNPVIEGQYKDYWLPWAEALVYTNEFQYWSVITWLDKYWKPADETNETLAQKLVNARIRNSASGIGRSAAGLSVEDQIARYRSYIRGRGRDEARAVRQAMSALRGAAVASLVGADETGALPPAAVEEGQAVPPSEDLVLSQTPTPTVAPATNCAQVMRRLGAFPFAGEGINGPVGINLTPGFSYVSPSFTLPAGSPKAQQIVAAAEHEWRQSITEPPPHRSHRKVAEYLRPDAPTNQFTTWQRITDYYRGSGFWGTNHEPYTRDGQSEWCGVFAGFVLRSVGLREKISKHVCPSTLRLNSKSRWKEAYERSWPAASRPAWAEQELASIENSDVIFTGITGHEYRSYGGRIIPPGINPETGVPYIQPGDVCCVGPSVPPANWHRTVHLEDGVHVTIAVEVTPQGIYTIEGNSGGWIYGMPPTSYFQDNPQVAQRWESFAHSPEVLQEHRRGHTGVIRSFRPFESSDTSAYTVRYGVRPRPQDYLDFGGAS